MDDEIDIEEHDLLDNPRLHDIFPDLSQIKVERHDDVYDDQPMDCDKLSNSEGFASHVDEKTEEYPRYGNKIILGSKPSHSSTKINENVENRKSSILASSTKVSENVENRNSSILANTEIKQEPFQDANNVDTVSDDEETRSQSSSVIIIGSKPCKTGVIEPIRLKDTVVRYGEISTKDEPLDIKVDNANKNVDYVIRDSVVLLENWGPRLENNACFCKKCDILFPTINTLHAHNNIAHSLLVVVKNKAVKSTAKKQGLQAGIVCNKNIAVKSTAKKQDVQAGIACNKNIAVKSTAQKQDVQAGIVCNKNIAVKSTAKKQDVQARIVGNKNKAVKSTAQKQDVQAVIDCNKNKTVKSTAQKQDVQAGIVCNKNEAVKSTPKKQDMQAGIVCNHCNKNFPDNDSLINHLYEVMTIKNSQPSKVQAKSSTGSSQASKKPNLENRIAQNNVPSLRQIDNKQTSIPTPRKIGNKQIVPNNVPTPNKIGNDETNIPTPLKIGNKQINLPDNVPTPNKIGNDETNAPTPLKIVNKPLTSVTTYSHKYKCAVCSEILMTYVKARQHRGLKHPEMKGVKNVIKRITYSSKALSAAIKTVNTPFARSKKSDQILSKQVAIPDKIPKVSQSTSEREPKISEVLIPVSVLFKCDKCDVHFTSCYPAMQHSKSCRKTPGEWTCEICQLSFKSWGRVMHNLQHKYSDTFSVYTCNEYIEGLVMNECPDCNSYLHEKDFLIHRNSGQPCEKKSFKCRTCSLSIHSSFATEHRNWHSKMKIDITNMILVKFIKTDKVKVASGPFKRQLPMDKSESSTDSKKAKFMKTDKVRVATGPVKRKLSTDESSTDSKKAKMELVKDTSKKIRAFYCTLCGCFLFGSQGKPFHGAGKCKLIKYHICKTCGLTCHPKHFVNKTCQRVKGNLLDMKFFTLKENKMICPPIPQYPKCIKCQVHFCSKKSVQNHDCKDSHKTCKYCKKRFSDLAHTLHVKYHLFQMNFANSTKATLAPKLPKPVKVSIPKTKARKWVLPDPDLLKNYQKPVLYLCVTCDIVCDIYDNAIEHCQKHFNNMKGNDFTAEHCEICDLKFDSSCYGRHMAMHDHEQNLDPNCFHIVKYEYRNLFKSNWNNILSDLPAVQTENIIASSIYRYCKSVKLKVVNEGPPESALYRCGKCQKYIHPFSLPNHYKSVICDNTPSKFRCRICQIPMTTTKARVHHVKLHRFYTKFMVIHFNEENDEEFNLNLRKHDASKVYLDKSVFRLHKCDVCQCCVQFRTRKRKHRCTNSKERHRCKSCGLYFNVSAIKIHMALHEMYPNVTRKNFQLISFKPKKNYLKVKLPTIRKIKNADLYQCKCGLHFTNLQVGENHLALCETNTIETSSEKCSKCGLLFDTTQLVTHLCKHHSSENENNTDFKISPLHVSKKVDSKGFTLYKCLKCNVHFTNHTSQKRHNQANHPKQKFAKCTECKLMFWPSCLNRHKKLHHKKLRAIVNKDGLRIKTSVQKPSQQDADTILKLLPKISIDDALKWYGKTLYKCIECKHPTFFFKRKSLANHYNRKRHNIRTQKCDECHYSFVQITPVHKYIHHRFMNLKREDFQIVVPSRRERADSVTSEEDIESSTEQDQPEAIRISNPVENPKPRAVAKKSTAKTVFSKGILTNDANRIKKAVTQSDTTDEDSIVGCESSNLDSIVGCESSNLDNQNISKEGIKKFKFFNILFKCEICEHHFLTGNHVARHIHETHLSNGPSFPSRLCSCGLIFTKNIFTKHQQLHHEKQDLNASDFHIVPVNCYKEVVGHKHLFRCGICKLNNMNLNKCEVHMKRIEHYYGKSRCPKCNLIFVRSTIGPHILLHHDILDLSIEDYIVMESVDDESLVLVDSVRQEDAPNEALPLTGDGINYNSHRLLKIDRVNEEFMKKNKQEIRNIYKNVQQLAKISATAAAKEYLKYLNETPSEFSDCSEIQLKNVYKQNLYRCGSCDTHFLHLDWLQKHIQNSKACPEKGIVCLICELKFPVSQIISHVKFQHKIENLVKSNFFITNSNDHESVALEAGKSQGYSIVDSQNDNSVVSKEEIPHDRTNREIPEKCITQENSIVDSENDKISVVSKEELEDGKTPRETPEKYLARKKFNLSTYSGLKIENYNNEIFQCNGCSLHFLSSHCLRKHLSSFKDAGKHVSGIAEICTFCDNAFTFRNLLKHVYIHHVKLKLSRYDLKVVDFNELQNRDNDVTPENFLERRKLSKSCYSEIEKEEMSNKLFKCNICTQHFLNVSRLKSHLTYYKNDKHEGYDLELCTFCEKSFSSKYLPKHIYIHHVKLKLSENDFDIIDPDDLQLYNDNMTPEMYLAGKNLSKSDYSELEKKKLSNELFKCNTCTVHFFSAHGLQKHINYYNRRTIHVVHDSAMCNFCGKTFTNKIMPTHVYIHHVKLKLSKNEFQVADSDSIQLKLNSSDKKLDDEMVDDECSEPTIEISTVDTSLDTTVDAGRNICSEIVALDNEISENLDEPREIADKISTLNTDLYSNILFKCGVCELHFLTSESLQWHIKNSQHDMQKSRCTSCGFAFNIKTLPTHVYIHHEKLKLSKNHFHINCSNDAFGKTNEENKSEGETSITIKNDFSSSSRVRKEVSKSFISKKIQKIAGSAHKVESNTNDFGENIATADEKEASVESADTSVVITEDIQSESAKKKISSKSSTPESKISCKKDNDIIKLYKCANCNVCFLNQTTCYKHVANHTPLDSKDYIECKLCDYQFMIINSLHTHIWKHHRREFKPENVLIEEYYPNVLVHGVPKIEIYYGSDKVQSKLVSTTSEGDSSIEIDDDDVVITDDHATASADQSVVSTNKKHTSGIEIDDDDVVITDDHSTVSVDQSVVSTNKKHTSGIQIDDDDVVITDDHATVSADQSVVSTNKKDTFGIEIDDDDVVITNDHATVRADQSVVSTNKKDTSGIEIDVDDIVITDDHAKVSADQSVLSSNKKDTSGIKIDADDVVITDDNTTVSADQSVVSINKEDTSESVNVVNTVKQSEVVLKDIDMSSTCITIDD